MPFYGGGRPDPGVTSVQQFCGGNVVLEAIDDGTVRVYADDGNGNAPTLTPSDAVLIGGALAALGNTAS